jgi:subfamily B ATP-binding cassette protein MsbA
MNKYPLLVKYASRCRNLIVLSIISGVANAIFNSVGVTLAIPIILSILDPSLLPVERLPSILSLPLMLFNGFSSDVKNILMAIAIFLIIVLRNTTNILNIIVNSLLVKKLTNSLKIDIFKILFSVDIDFFHTHNIGELVSSLNIESFKTGSSIKSFLDLFRTAINVFIFLVILIYISWQITIIAMAFLLLLSWRNKFFRQKAKKIGEKQKEISQAYNQNIIEKFTGIRLVKSFSQEKQEYSKLCELVEETEKMELKAQYTYIFIQPIDEILGVLIILIIVLIGKYFLWDYPEALATTLLTYLVILFRTLPLVSTINQQRTTLANQSSAVEVIDRLLNTKDKPFLPQGTKKYSSLEKGITFEKVSFKYPNFPNLVLQDINLFIPKNKITALVGASGSGKSTLGDLFARFYDPIEGKIFFDDTNYQDFELDSIRKKMAIVSQDTFLFNDTVKNNICYGLEKVSFEDIIQATKYANAYNFIMELPQQFDTKIGDRGVILSGGQKQLLAIARAILRNPELLLLDEATSALDTVSEKIVQQALDKLCVNRTTLVIAHRLSTIQNADQIVVLDQGKIQEMGTHQELLACNGSYQKLYQMHFVNSY